MTDHRIILFRGMNTGGVRAPVADQRRMAEAMGLGNPRTLLASGNLVVESDHAPATLEREVEAAMEKTFGLKIAAMVRSTDQWAKLIAACPFPDEAAAHPSKTLLMVMKDGVKDGGLDALRAFAVGDERAEATPGALWFFHPDGIGQSKMAEKASQIRLTGMGTARNWNTVMKLAEMVGVKV
ncbi:MAG TPA: DUF1697 domain-containing protein [Brevundimonas sp.]|jgi:uncharacterized protein (DUF1697 family)|uniref:DUF1697 domain-containing protein n=1 Tax=Brevundimonas sp. TaxID=1871086 RepID=UPI002DE532F3|nr:DUF1697 domain-containing protein [Brevundimonas sp.]